MPDNRFRAPAGGDRATPLATGRSRALDMPDDRHATISIVRSWTPALLVAAQWPRPRWGHCKRPRRAQCGRGVGVTPAGAKEPRSARHATTRPKPLRVRTRISSPLARVVLGAPSRSVGPVARLPGWGSMSERASADPCGAAPRTRRRNRRRPTARTPAPSESRPGFQMFRSRQSSGWPSLPERSRPCRPCWGGGSHGRP